jgi:hypothetical protein
LESDEQMPIVTHSAQIRGEAVGELKAILEIAVGARLLMGPQRRDHLRGDCGVQTLDFI